MAQRALQQIPKEQREAAKKKRLLSVIQKKREVLKQLVIKTEILRNSLEMAKQEYMVKVGSLFLKDNHLELEIIRYRNILLLIDEGRTYDQAVEELSETFYAQQVAYEREQQKIKEDEQILMKRVEQEEETIMEDIKQIWKRLIAKFHPDLTQDPKEKKERDSIMKQINKAYQELDYDQLVKIEKDNFVQDETTINNLEEILLTLMTDIEKEREEFRSLKDSEWFGWMEKIERAKRRKENIFAQTERQLLDDIVAKYDVLNALKNQIRQKDTSASLL